MGYGIKEPGIWNGKKHFTWKLRSGKAPAKLELALAAWEKELGITFTKSEADSVDFHVSAGGSQTGWADGQKQLNFKGDESMGTVLHEIGHLLGLSHEHDRSDSREDYYDADTRNGGFGLEGAKIRAAKLKEYGPYDRASIMQYPASSYEAKVAPSEGDVSTVKAINGW